MRISLTLLLLAVGCASEKDFAITGKEWTVVAIDTIQAPIGTGGRPITMRFDDSTRRVYGFAGCNQYNASYTLQGDSLSFGPGVSTRMACPGFNGIEEVFLADLADITEVQYTGEVLILSGHGKAIRARILAR